MFYLENAKDIEDLIKRANELWKSGKVKEGSEVDQILPALMNMIDGLYRDLNICEMKFVEAIQILSKNNIPCPYTNNGSCTNPICWDEFLTKRAKHAWKAADEHYKKKKQKESE